MEDLARHTGAAMVYPQYTTAPKQQFPYQYEQMFNVLQYFLQNGEKHDLKVESIALAGDSVGGMWHQRLARITHVNDA